MFKNIVLAFMLVFAFCSASYADEIDSVLDTSTSGGTCSGGTCKLPNVN
jgi:hypothetical protein